jgi:hypothetical protein
MKRLLFCALLGVALVGVGCDASSETDTYSVTLSDEDGAPVYTGELRLKIEPAGPADEPGEVTGRWQLGDVGDAPSLVETSGVVRGSTTEGVVEIDLVMEASDSGIELGGTYDGDRMAGEWATVTIAGPIPSGTFEAIRD